MAEEKMTREEAIQFLTRQSDLSDDTVRSNDLPGYITILQETGNRIGYTPAFRCLVMGLEPEESIRWGK